MFSPHTPTTFLKRGTESQVAVIIHQHTFEGNRICRSYEMTPSLSGTFVFLHRTSVLLPRRSVGPLSSPTPDPLFLSDTMVPTGFKFFFKINKSTTELVLQGQWGFISPSDNYSLLVLLEMVVDRGEMRLNRQICVVMANDEVHVCSTGFTSQKGMKVVWFYQETRYK